MEERIKAIITAISKLNYGLASSLLVEEVNKSPEAKYLHFLNPALNEANQDNYGLAAVSLTHLIKYLEQEKAEKKAEEDKKLEEAIAAKKAGEETTKKTESKKYKKDNK